MITVPTVSVLLTGFATPSEKHPKRPSHAVIKTALIRVVMWSVNFLCTKSLQSSPGDDSSLEATALFAKFDRKRRDRWSEAIWSIDFLHFSRKIWKILNNITGRYRHSSPHCPV